MYKSIYLLNSLFCMHFSGLCYVGKTLRQVSAASNVLYVVSNRIMGSEHHPNRNTLAGLIRDG